MKVILRYFEQDFLEMKITWFLKNVPRKTQMQTLAAVSSSDARELVEMQWTLLQTLETLNWTLICLIRARGVSAKVEGPKMYCYSNISSSYSHYHGFKILHLSLSRSLKNTFQMVFARKQKRNWIISTKEFLLCIKLGRVGGGVHCPSAPPPWFYANPVYFGFFYKGQRE